LGRAVAHVVVTYVGAADAAATTVRDIESVGGRANEPFARGLAERTATSVSGISG